MRDRFRCANEPRPELHAGGAKLKIGHDRFAAANATGDEHRHLMDDRQYFLGQNGCGYRPRMAITTASAPMRINFFARTSAGAKQIALAPESLMRRTADEGGRPPARTT